MSDRTLTAKLADKLSAVIKIETTAEKGIKGKKFEEFRDCLFKLFPYVYKHLACTVIAGASLIFHWKGKRSDAPLVLLAHMDVVPAEETQLWTHPPFEGYIDEKYVWGRGAIDDKHQIIFQLGAVEELLKTGFCPHQDIYLCYGHNEETMENPSGALETVNYFKEKKVVPGLVLDEGGGVFEDTILKNNRYYSFISLCEKGYADVLLTAEGNGGHSSIPYGKSALNYVTTAACLAEDMPAENIVNDTVRLMVSILCHEADDAGIIRMLERSPGGRALIQSTVAFTMAKGSPAPNILPQKAEAILNCRLIHGDTVKNMLERIQKIAEPYGVTAEIIEGYDPSDISGWSSTSAVLVREIASEVFPDAIPCPNLMTGGSDAKYYSAIAKNILRFVPVKLTPEEKGCMHGVNERIPIDALIKGVEFYEKLITRYGKGGN